MADDADKAQITLDDLKGELPQRILDKITVDEETGCWIFDGDPSSNGYMRCWWQGLRWMAHRLIYEVAFSKDIRKYQLDHLCENRPCCNPNHMDPVTPKVNCKRRHRRRKKI